MSESTPVAGSAESSSAESGYVVRTRQERFRGNVITVVTDDVTMPGGGTAARDYIRHPGAVGIVALDDQDRIRMLRQYRHPVRAVLWEVPAGLLDFPGEDPLAAARRELFEEGALRADRWDLLVDAYTSPGCSDEAIRVFLARDVQAVAEQDRYVGVDEEADMTCTWVDLDEARRMAFAGEIENAMCLVAVLAAAAARDQQWQPLRPADDEWAAAHRRAHPHTS